MNDYIRETIKKYFYYFKNRKKNIDLGKNCYLGGFDTFFEGNNKIGNNSFFHGRIGYGSYIGRYCSINGIIGRYCSIADNVNIVVGQHPTSKFVSTHPAFFSIRKQAGFTYVKKESFKEIHYADNFKHPVIIGNDVWIGYGAVLLSGICIGDGAIIAAGSIVTKDVASYSIVGGVPAKQIKKRFTETQIEKLLKIKWWNKPENWIKKYSEYFNDVSVFLDKIQEEL